MITEFMCDPLPDIIDPWALARQGSRLQGFLPRARLRRLPALVCELLDEPQVDLQFSIDFDGQSCVEGQIGARVTVMCQRCLKPCELSLHAHIALGLVADESAAERLAVHYEPLIAAVEVELTDVVEDELLLLLPVFPRHPEGDCQMPAVSQQSSEVVELNTRRPFADLRTLWQRDQSESS